MNRWKTAFNGELHLQFPFALLRKATRADCKETASNSANSFTKSLEA